jgi:hypothetical protein
MPWHVAKHDKAFMAIQEGFPPNAENSWYERNKERFHQWAETGIPVPADNITFGLVKPEPFQIVAMDGKLIAVYRRPDGTLYQEQVKDAPPTPTVEPEMQAKQEETVRLATPGAPAPTGKVIEAPDTTPVPSKRQGKW